MMFTARGPTAEKKKQGEKTKRLKAKNKKLKEQVASNMEVATSDLEIPHLMYIDVKTAEHGQRLADPVLGIL